MVTVTILSFWKGLHVIKMLEPQTAPWQLNCIGRENTSLYDDRGCWHGLCYLFSILYQQQNAWNTRVVIFLSAFLIKILDDWDGKRSLVLSVLWNFLIWSSLGVSFGALRKWQSRKINHPVANYPSYFKFSPDKVHLLLHIKSVSISGTVDWLMRFCSDVLALLVLSLCTFSCCWTPNTAEKYL